MATHPPVLEPWTDDEGKRQVVTRGLAPRNEGSGEFARPEGTRHLLAGCKGRMKGTKVLDHQVSSTAFKKPALLLSIGTSTTEKMQEKGFRDKI